MITWRIRFGIRVVSVTERFPGFVLHCVYQSTLPPSDLPFFHRLWRSRFQWTLHMLKKRSQYISNFVMWGMLPTRWMSVSFYSYMARGIWEQCKLVCSILLFFAAATTPWTNLLNCRLQINVAVILNIWGICLSVTIALVFSMTDRTFRDPISGILSNLLTSVIFTLKFLMTLIVAEGAPLVRKNLWDGVNASEVFSYVEPDVFSI